MIGSMDGWSALRHMGRAVLLAAFAFGFGTTLSMAQQGQHVPKTAPKSATNAAPAPAGGAAAAAAGGTQGDDSGWVKVCMTNEKTGNKQVCLVSHEGLDPNTGIVLVGAAVRTIEGEDKPYLLINVLTAYSLVMPAGVQIKIDEGEPISLQYAVCLPTSCEVQMELTKEMLDKMRTGKQMVVSAMNMQQETMAFPLPLTGFGKASDGAPVDNAKYQEARRQMMEKSRQRQIELTNKAAEAQQKNQQAGGQPQADGTPAQPAGPNATIAQPKRPPAPAPQ